MFWKSAGPDPEIERSRQRIAELEAILVERDREMADLRARFDSAERNQHLQIKLMSGLNTFAKSFSLGRDGVNTLVETVQGHEAHIHGMQEKADTVLSSTHDCDNRLSELSALARSAEARMDKLNVSAQEITQILSLIREISNQTQLLALNAAIEAARAGEAGRGFAVVADEVRKLASSTQDATGDITRIVAAITSESIASVEQVGTLADGVVETKGTMEKSLDDIKCLIDGARTLDKERDATILQCFLAVTRFDHIGFKLRIYRHLLGLERVDHTGLSSGHANCKLGKWATQGEGKARFGHLAAMRNLERPHGSFHDSGKAAAAASSLEEALPYVFRMEDASIEVIQTLDQLEREILQAVKIA